MGPLAELAGNALTFALVALVFLGAIPLVVATYQFARVGMNRWHSHLDKTDMKLPNVAILIPAWNEGAVLGASLDRLLAMDYPAAALRLYVVDDASTDDTPDVILRRVASHPSRVHHLRREQGGEGKAHTLNHGLRVVMADTWAEAVLIMDADVVFQPRALRHMVRHLADPEVGAVTAYIKEGSEPANWMNRFISYEYIAAQAASRRSQNTSGAIACLAGGAQLHSRANLDGLGGQIDTSSLAEDTFTTFHTQLNGKRVVFEGNAVVWAEEPTTIDGLWKQRLRWARGNVQVTQRFKHLWFRRSDDHQLGSFMFGLSWFSLFLLPVLMVGSCIGLLGLFVINSDIAWPMFRLLWIINAIAYLFITSFTLQLDPGAARKCWRQAIMFPGYVSLAIIAFSCFPTLVVWLVDSGLHAVGVDRTPLQTQIITIFMYGWIVLGMVVARLAHLIERRLKRDGDWLSRGMVQFSGYGALLCAITFTSYVKELRGAEMKWEKTEKTGKVVG